MADEQKCPHCGKPVPPTALQGICPECMLKAGFATQAEEAGAAGAHGTKVIQPPPQPAEITSLFPQLEILECLGRGGMGVVYKARQPRLNRLVALKILARDKEHDPQFAQRFVREAQTLAQLNHPNIVTVYDFGETDGLCYLLMEFVDGVSLRQLLQGGKVEPAQALAIVPRICEALQYAHEQGVVHRDIKPENILLDKTGRVKIADFGIAKMLGGEPGQQSLTGAKDVVGTPHYMAPEQIEKPKVVDHRADIYSLGVVFYEMLTGELPLGKFAAPSKKVQVDVRLDEVVLRTLEKEPERRYQQASEVKTRVETIASTKSTPAPQGTPSDLSQSAPQGTVHKGLLWYGFIVSVIGLPVGLALHLPLVWGLSIAGLAICAFRLSLLKKQPLRSKPGEPRSKYEVGPHMSRTAIVGVCWAAFFFLTAIVANLFANSLPTLSAYYGSRGFILPLRGSLLLLLFGLPGLTAPFGTTILGWTAVSQIRHSAGRLYGLGLALFDGLLFPVLALNGLIIWIGNVFGDQLAAHFAPAIGLGSFSAMMVILIVLACAAPTILISRYAWSVVNQPLAYSQSKPRAGASVQPPGTGGAWKVGAAVIAAGLIVLTIPVGSILLSVYLPHLTRPQRMPPAAVVRIEEELRHEIEARMEQAGYKPDSVSVSVSPSLDKAECLLGPVSKHGLYSEGWNGSFELQQMGNGLWLVEGQGELRALRFSVDVSGETQGAGKHPLAEVLGKELSFGPVMERVVTNMIDFESGTLVDLPLEEQPGERDPARYDWFNNDPSAFPWMRQHGIDGFVANHGLIGVDLLAAELKPKDWNNITPENLRAKLRELGLSQAPPHWDPRRVDGIYGFETRSGSIGVLQLDPHVPHGVKIRYKLAQPARRSSADLPSRSPTSPVTGGELSRADGATGALNAADGVGQIAATEAKRSADASGVADSSRSNPDVLGVQIRQAEAEVARLKGMVKANLVAPHDLEVAQDKLEILKAQWDGDDVKVAQTRVMAAERRLKRTSDLFEKGLVAASEFDAAKAEVEIRQAELRAAQAAREPGASFGPVIERVVNGSGAKSGFQGLDLESGDVFTITAEDTPDDNDLVKKWVDDHGIDLLARNKGGSKWQLAGIDTKLAPVAAGWWYSTSDDALRWALEEARMEEFEGWRFVSVHVDDSRPLVFAVQTSSGTVGLLRIARSTNNEHGLKIRYKLVNPTGGPAARR